MSERVKQVRSFEEACQTLEEASKSGESIVLQNSKTLHKFGGFMYVREMMEKAAAKFPDACADIIYDAGDDAVVAVSAVSGGFRKVRFTGDEKVFKKLCEIAVDFDAEIID